MLFLQRKNQHFWWGNNEALVFFERLMRRLIFFWRNNEAPDFFNCRNNIIRVIEVTSQLALLFFSDKNEAPHCLFRKESSLALSLQKNAAPHHSFRKNQVSHYLFRKKWTVFLKK
jgi:hypothetical protein